MPVTMDPWLLAQLDAAVAPYAGRLPPAELAWMREQLAELLLEDRAAAELVDLVAAARPDEPRVVERSGEVARPGAAKAARHRAG